MSQATKQDDAVGQRPEADRLCDKDYNRIAALIGKEAGIRLTPAKRLMVEGRLRKRVRGLGLASLTEYCRFLFDDGGLGGELVHIIDAVSTNKTDFFREAEHFTCLEKNILPALIGRRRSDSRIKLKLWSAASSNGAEAYTIAMVMADVMAKNRNIQFAVLGTDISTEMLAAAEQAIYPAEMIAPVPPEMQKRYVMRGSNSSSQNKVRIVPELRRLVRFERLNLMDPSYPIDEDVDVIFLRNVLIYFDKPTQEAVIRRLIGHLRPGGFLILGHSESMIGTNMRLQQWAPGVFQAP